MDYLEVAFLAILGAFVAASWVSFTLAEVGVDRPLVVLIVGVVGLMVTLAALMRRNWQPVDVRELLGALLPVGLGVALDFPPDEWIFGALDPGAYVNTGAIIARTGAILAPDPFLASLNPAVRNGLFPFPASRLPAIYLTTLQFRGLVPTGFVNASDHVVPHGFHFYPTVLAFGYAVGGIWTELDVTPVLAIGGLLASYLLWRRLFGYLVGTLATCFLALCSAEVWFARYPDAEILAQLLLCGGLFAFVVSIDSPSKWTSLVAGLCLGAVHLTKIEALALPFLIALYLGYEIVSGRYHPSRLWFIVAYLVLLGQAIVHAVLISGWYTASSFGGTFSRRALLIIAAILLAGVAAYAAILVVPWLRSRSRACFESNALATASGAFLPLVPLVLALYAYYVRPSTFQGSTSDPTQLLALNDAESFVRLGWYLGPIGLLLGALGWAFLARGERNYRCALPVMVLAVDTILYLDHTHITPIHYWAARRWITDIIPGMCLAAAYFLIRLGRVSRHAWFDLVVPTGLGVVMLLGLYNGTRPLLGYVEYRGAVTQLAALASEMPKNAVVLFAEGDSGERLSTPLEYLFDRTSFVVWPAASELTAARQGASEWLAEGRPVFWINTPTLPGPDQAGLSGQIVARQHVAVVEKLAETNAPPGLDGLFQQDLQIWRIDRALGP